MRKSFAQLASVFGALLTLVWTSNSTAAEPAAAESDAVFGPTRVWKIHLHVTAENWKTMQPQRGGFPGFGPPGAQPGGAQQRPGASQPPAPPNGPPGGFRPGSFGYEFDYVKADLELDGETFKDVGLRFKGNGTYMMTASGKKRPFKVDFNRFVEDQRFHGMQQLNLHNNVMDPTSVRQALSYPVFEAAGIPSPRTAFAEVSLTIDGECDHERLGLYTLVEEIDKAFLKRHFQTTKGMLLKPEGTQGLEYKGEDWTQNAWYEPKSKPRKDEAKRLIDALRIIHTAEDKQFRDEIGSYLDLDEFARFLAANTLLANMDSFLTHVHNYYLYLPPDGKFVVLPWDLDLSMGAFFMAGSAEQLQELSISHPHMGANKLLDRLMEWDAFTKMYREHLKQLTETCFGESGQTIKSLPVVQAAIKEQIAADQKQAQAARGQGGFGPGVFGGPGGQNPFGSNALLETFLVKRRESVLAQLAGTSKGRIPGMSFGGFGGPPGGPRPGGPGAGGGGFGAGNFHGGQILRAADGDQDKKVTRKEFLDLGAKWLLDWDKDKDKSLSASEITAGLNDALAPPANAGFKPPEGFGPGNFLTAPLQKVADTDSDGTTTREEWITLFGTWFKDWDTSGDKNLDEPELVAGLNKVFAPPAGFGGPPGAPANPPRATENK